jgi:PAS domain S-box-containing protein
MNGKLSVQRAQHHLDTRPSVEIGAPLPPPTQRKLTFKMRWGLNAALTLAIIVLGAVGWISYRNMKAGTEADTWVVHTHVVIEGLGGLLSSIRDAGAGCREYILSGDQRYLQSYQSSVTAVGKHLNSLRDLTADNPRQQQRLAALSPLIDARLAELRDTVALRESKGSAAALDMLMKNWGKNTMERIRGLVAEAQADEEQSLHVRIAAKEAGTKATIHSVLLGDALGGLTLLCLFASLKIELARRHRAESEVRRHRDHLQDLVTLRTRDLERANADLFESAEKLRLFARHAPAAIAMLDTEFRYIATSQRWLADFGLRGQNLTGLSHYDVFPEIPERWREIYGRCLGGAIERAEEDRFERADGTPQWIRWEVRPWFTASGAIGGIVVFSEDITDRKIAEQQIQIFSQRIITAREEERKDISAALHHDVGSMVVGVSAHLDAVEEYLRSGSHDEALTWLTRTRRQFDNAAATLKRVAVQIRPPELDTIGVSAALQQMFSEIASHRTTLIRFHETLGQDRLPGITSTVIYRIAQEAVSNAIKHGGADRIDVNLRKSQSAITLTVQDNGRGFDPDAQRLRATSQMGLRLMQEMATSIGGSFSIDSAQGKGTAVCASFLLEPESPAPGATTPRKSLASTAQETPPAEPELSSRIQAHP